MDKEQNPTTTMKTIVHTLKATHKDKTILGYQRYELVPVPLTVHHIY